MNERSKTFDFNFMPSGQAIKKSREAKQMIREMKPTEFAELSELAVVFYYSIFLYLILYNVNIDY